MTIVAAATIGGILAGVTYWVLDISNNTSLTLSATPLNDNIYSVPLTLTSTTGQAVSFSVNAVDTGFNNPAGVNNTYGVVGGNTDIFGPQVLCSVAIRQAETSTIVSDSASTDVYGAGTDFATSLVVGAALQTADGVDLGFVQSIGGQTLTSVTYTTAGTNIVTAVSTGGLVVDKPIVFDANIGGITAGYVYYVQSIINATDFMVATQPIGTPLLLSTAAATVTATQDVVTLAANSPVSVISNGWAYATNEDGFIVRQKGRSKFLVTGSTSGLTGICYTADSAAAGLTVGTMSIGITLASAATAYVERISDHNAAGFSGATATPYIVTFNAAQPADSTPAQPYEIVQVDSM